MSERRRLIERVRSLGNMPLDVRSSGNIYSFNAMSDTGYQNFCRAVKELETKYPLTYRVYKRWSNRLRRHEPQ